MDDAGALAVRACVAARETHIQSFDRLGTNGKVLIQRFPGRRTAQNGSRVSAGRYAAGGDLRLTTIPSSPAPSSKTVDGSGTA